MQALLLKLAQVTLDTASDSTEFSPAGVAAAALG